MLNCKITFYCGNKTLNKNLGVCEIEGSVLAGVTVGVKVALLETGLQYPTQVEML